MDYVQLGTFFLVLTRATAFAATAPFFALGNIPNMAKIVLGFVLALVLTPMLGISDPALFANFLSFMLAALFETGIGLCLGLLATLVLSAVRVTGQFMDFQVGLIVSGTFDPLSADQATILSRFLFLLSILVFLILDGHHMLINGLSDSYRLVPPGGVTFQQAQVFVGIRAFAQMFTIALQMALPIIAVVVITDISLGFIGRTAPQMNIFMLGFPMKIAVGFMTLVIVVPFLGVIFRTLFQLIQTNMNNFLRGFV